MTVTTDASGPNRPAEIARPTASGVVHSKPTINQPERRLTYAEALTSLKEVETALPFFCMPKRPSKTIGLPLREAVSYRSVVEKLLSYGQAGAITLDHHR